MFNVSLKLSLSLIVCKRDFDRNVRERPMVGAKREHAHVNGLPRLIQRLVGSDRQLDSVGELDVDQFLFAEIAKSCSCDRLPIKSRRGLGKVKFHDRIPERLVSTLMHRWLIVIVVADIDPEVDRDARDRLTCVWVIDPCSQRILCSESNCLGAGQPQFKCIGGLNAPNRKHPRTGAESTPLMEE